MARTPNQGLEDRRMECLAQALEAERLAMAVQPGVRESYLGLAQAVVAAAQRG